MPMLQLFIEVVGEGVHIIMERRLLDALCLTLRNFATFQSLVKNEVTVDVHGCVLFSPLCICIYMQIWGGSIYISAWASALLVQLNWAMRRPRSVGRVTGTDSRAFFIKVRDLILLIYSLGNLAVKNVIKKHGHN